MIITFKILWVEFQRHILILKTGSIHWVVCFSIRYLNLRLLISTIFFTCLKHLPLTKNAQHAHQVCIFGVSTICYVWCLTHWGRDEIATIWHATFWNAFLKWKCLNFNKNFTEVCSWGADWQYSIFRRVGAKPLCELMMVNLLTHMCVTRPQWVNWRKWYAKTQIRTYRVRVYAH